MAKGSGGRLLYQGCEAGHLMEDGSTRSAASYDVIGDVHGSASKLEGLLALLGWRRGNGGTWSHPDPRRQVVFVGDLVDRGSDQLGVLRTARSMLDCGAAQVVMGNHEFNAICYATPDPDNPGEFLRPNSSKNRAQHEAFLSQVDEGERVDWLAWFATLPLWLDLGDLKVVHACWHPPSIELLASGSALGGDRFPSDIEGWVAASRRGDPIYEAVETILKGPEINLERYGLPAYVDHQGVERHEARACWWRSEASDMGELVDIPSGSRTARGDPYPDLGAVPVQRTDEALLAGGDGVPIFYGHYWRRWPAEPDESWSPSAACVDFSAVMGGPLVAYCWRGEDRIDPSHYVAFDED